MVTAWQQDRRRKQAAQLKSESVAGLEALLAGVGGIADEQQRQTREAQTAEERKRKAAMDEAEVARRTAADSARVETERSRAASNVLREKRLATETEAQNAERETRAGVLRQKADAAEAERKREEAERKRKDAITGMSRRMDALTSRADVEKAATEAGMAPDEFLAAVGEVDEERLGEKEKTASKLDLDEARAEQARASAAKAARAPVAKGPKSPQAVTKDASKLRIEYIKRPEVADAVKSRIEFRKMEQSANNPSAGGDLALIFSFMKVLDPGSTVREGEFATAQNAAAVPDRVRNEFNRIMSGQRLSPEQRADFLNQARGFYTSQQNEAEAVRRQYADIAKRSGYNPIDVVGDDTPAPQAAAPAAPVTVPDDTSAVPPAGESMVRVIFDGKVKTIPKSALAAALADGAKLVNK
jgi:hypothetical protein